MYNVLTQDGCLVFNSTFALYLLSYSETTAKGTG